MKGLRKVDPQVEGRPEARRGAGELRRLWVAWSADDDDTKGQPLRFFNRGVKLLESGDAEGAITVFARAAELAPNMVGAYAMRAVALQTVYEYAEAVKACDQALSYERRLIEKTEAGESTDYDGFEYVGWLHVLRADCIDSAEFSARNTVTAQFGDLAAKRRLMVGTRYGDAIADCDRAIELFRRSSDAPRLRATGLHLQAYWRKAVLLRTVGRPDDVITCCREALLAVRQDDNISSVGPVSADVYRQIYGITNQLEWAFLDKEADKQFDESKVPSYTEGHGGPVADAGEISREAIHARVESMPREQLPALAKLIDDFAVGVIEATANTRLSRLEGRFAKRLREIELPENGFTTLAQLKAADQLAKTYRDLRDVRRKLKLPEMEKPEAVAKAEALASDWRRHHDKNGAVIPPRPLGRPRRIASGQTTSSLR
jgi:tetratricopeptide (TPR) repeat protein